VSLFDLCLQPLVQTKATPHAALVESVEVVASVMLTAGTVATAAVTSATSACSVSNSLHMNLTSAGGLAKIRLLKIRIG